MKTIKHPDTFQCEVCSMDYSDPEMALKCEASKPEQTFQEGQTLVCKSGTEFKILTAELWHRCGWAQVAGHKWLYHLSQRFYVDYSDVTMGERLEQKFSASEIESIMQGLGVTR